MNPSTSPALRRIVTALCAAVLFSSPAIARAQTAPLAVPDILVVGGTPAGVAAAVTAARAGETVVLASGADDLGGTLTDAMMDQWDLNLAPDGASVEGGIFAEIYARLGDVFMPSAAERTFADMAASEPNISVRYDAQPVEAVTTPEAGDRRVAGVTFRDTRSGALDTIRAAYVIDATDSGDVAALAGARYDLGRQDSGIDERAQAVTEMFTLDDVSWPALSASYDPVRYGTGGVLGRVGVCERGS